MLDRHPFAGPLTNESQRLGQNRIGHRKHIRRLPNSDALRRDLLFHGGWRLTLHQPVEPLSRFVTNLFGIGNDAGKRRITKIAEQLVVIDADDGHLFRHGDVFAGAGVEDMLSAQIIRGENPHRLGERADPVDQSCLVLFPYL